jgi:hypothetical protein
MTRPSPLKELASTQLSGGFAGVEGVQGEVLNFCASLPALPLRTLDSHRRSWFLRFLRDTLLANARSPGASAVEWQPLSSTYITKVVCRRKQLLGPLQPSQASSCSTRRS